MSLTPQLCLNCRAMCDATSGYDQLRRPMPGCWTICIFCGHVMSFDARMHLRELTHAESSVAADDRNIALVRKVIGELGKYPRKEAAA